MAPKDRRERANVFASALHHELLALLDDFELRFKRDLPLQGAQRFDTLGDIARELAARMLSTGSIGALVRACRELHESGTGAAGAVRRAHAMRSIVQALHLIPEPRDVRATQEATRAG